MLTRRSAVAFLICVVSCALAAQVRLLPPQVRNAHQVMLVVQSLDTTGEADSHAVVLERQLKDELKQWGRFGVVDQPALADLVIVINETVIPITTDAPANMDAVKLVDRMLLVFTLSSYQARQRSHIWQLQEQLPLTKPSTLVHMLRNEVDQAPAEKPKKTL